MACGDGVGDSQGAQSSLEEQSWDLGPDLRLLQNRFGTSDKRPVLWDQHDGHSRVAEEGLGLTSPTSVCINTIQHLCLVTLFNITVTAAH